jgi:hypothetical protein
MNTLFCFFDSIILVLRIIRYLPESMQDRFSNFFQHGNRRRTERKKYIAHKDTKTRSNKPSQRNQFTRILARSRQHRNFSSKPPGTIHQESQAVGCPPYDYQRINRPISSGASPRYTTQVINVFACLVWSGTTPEVLNFLC